MLNMYISIIAGPKYISAHIVDNNNEEGNSLRGAHAEENTAINAAIYPRKILRVIGIIIRLIW